MPKPKLYVKRAVVLPAKPLTKRKQGETNGLFSMFKNSVNYCIAKMLEHGVSSRASIHRLEYENWKHLYPNHATHYFHSAARIASQSLKSWRNKCRKGEASWDKPPVYKADCIRFDDHLARLKGEVVDVTVNGKKHLHLPLQVSQKRLRKHRNFKPMKEITIFKRRGQLHTCVAYHRKVTRRKPGGVAGIDTNERTLNLSVLKPTNEEKRIPPIDVGKAQAIHHAMELKRKRIQKKMSVGYHPVLKRRLLTKYRSRERNRVKDVLYKARNQVRRVLIRENAMPIMEKLTGIRKRINKTHRRDMRRRLNHWPFRKAQAFVEQGAALDGYMTLYVSARWTSQKCPKCGRLNKPNGHLYRCRYCGYEDNRHHVGAHNLAESGLERALARGLLKTKDVGSTREANLHALHITVFYRHTVRNVERRKPFPPKAGRCNPWQRSLRLQGSHG